MTCLGVACLGMACLGVMIVKLYSTQISDLGMACLDVVCHDSKIDPIHISGSNFEATVDVDMLGPNGYLSIVDWPLLPFYGLMCGLYVAMGLGWLVVMSCELYKNPPSLIFKVNFFMSKISSIILIYFFC